MANQEHLDYLEQGAAAWNSWRNEHPTILHPDLSEIDLRSAHLYGINLAGANLCSAILRGSDLREADLHEADLRGADLSWTTLYRANLEKADLRGINLRGADLRRVNLHQANLQKADLRDVNLRLAEMSCVDMSNAWLSNSVLVETNLEQADLPGCSVYGVAAWNLKLTGASQTDLVITRVDEPIITLDNLLVAQFIYLLLNNAEIRNVIDTIGKKAVLILGRFTEERKKVLDALRDALRVSDYIPILFDFDKPGSRDLTETIKILAGLSRFIIADLTDAKSIPQELTTIVPEFPSVVIQPIIMQTEQEYAMFEHFKRYPWVLPVYRYADTAQLLSTFDQIVTNVEAKARTLIGPS